MEKMDTPIGGKIRYKGKDAICTALNGGNCKLCILRQTAYCDSDNIACFEDDRADSTSVYFPEVKQQLPPWSHIGEEAVPCPEQNGDNEWCNKESSNGPI